MSKYRVENRAEISVSAQLGTDGVLLATRTQPVKQPIPIGNEDFIDPENLYVKQVNWGVLRRGRYGESFLLIERRFAEAVDWIFGGLPSTLIEYYLEKGVNPVKILDIGGGRDGRTARDIAEHYPGTDVTNIDMVAIDEASGNFTSKKGDIVELDLPADRFEIIYSHQVVPRMSTADGYARPLKVIDKVAESLIPGGVGVIDFTNNPFDAAVLDKISHRVPGLVLPKRKRDKKQGLMDGFLVLLKDPVESAVLNLSRGAPDTSLSAFVPGR